MNTYEERLAAWEQELRDKYNDDDRKQMAKSGEAMPDGSYPIADQQDLGNAIHAVGRGGADHDAIRKHIIARAHALGHADMIPDNWNTDGSLKESKSRRRGDGKSRRERHRSVPLQPEVRFFSPEGLEVRSSQNTDEILITGSPIVYGVGYSVVDFFGEFRETIHHGSVSPLLARGVDCRFLLNHQGMAMARTTSGTLVLRDTPASLTFTARLDARQQMANDFAIAVERGDMTQMSIGMIVKDDNWGWDRDEDMETRDIYLLDDLLDVSGVTYACSTTTHMEVAQRMMFSMMPVQSRARLRQMEVELRSGKVLSASSQSKLVTALSALHDLAEAGGVEFSNGDGDEDDTQSQATESTDAMPAEHGVPPEGETTDEGDGGTSTTDDATIAGNVAGDGSPGYQDGSGTRTQVDPGTEQVSSTARATRLRLMRATRRLRAGK